jgi:hypothetical protein
LHFFKLINTLSILWGAYLNFTPNRNKFGFVNLLISIK